MAASRLALPLRRLQSGLALLALLCLTQTTLAAGQIRIAVSDIGAGGKPAGGGLVDVLHAQKRLENEFAGDGIAVQWVFVKGAGPVINEAFANGQVDMAYLGDLASIVGKAGNLDTRVVAAAARGVNHYLAVRPGSSIETLADLKGKRVGLFRGTAAQLSFISALRSSGLSERDLQVINLDFAAASAALAAGHIDATWGGNNALALAERGLAELPVSTRNTAHGAGQLSGLVLVSERFAKQHPDWLPRLLKVQREAARWAGEPANREAYIELQATQSGYPQSLLRAELEGADLAHLLSPELDEAFVAQLRESIDTALEARLIRRPVDLGRWLEPRFLEQSRTLP
ncbi:ABC transporter substrate-binding protein [Phytopseudomonas dryadis]|uniref:Nitrate ABC transporter substrate-binding protein n=1 Tax=Phytopseudomonas dryadis TaxID=2487520 RepID=A0ABY1ZD61_9GAMM|nr:MULTISPECIES: ABC transporter substrate-binding protein [Pseudomonas]TBV07982.1 nitrate ABC transporter substrate-binding protein [Pseudomonas dryadis]TBV19377.1 nitrate ABC transporter substrate-binding protein [Pseudomonas sp. FRB 230]